MKKLFAILLVAALTACGGSGVPADPTAPQQGGPGVGTGAVLGGLAGYMLGRSASGGGGGGVAPTTTHTTVIQKRTVIINKPAPVAPPVVRTAPSYRPAPSYSRPSTPSFRGGRR